MCGTLEFVAPEVFQENYDEKCDIWSVGVITYMLLTDKSPFIGNTEEETRNMIQNHDYTSNLEWKELSNKAKSFIKGLLTRDVDKRFSAEEAVNDQWLQQKAKHQYVDLDKKTKVKDEMKLFKFIGTLVCSEAIKASQTDTFHYLDQDRDGFIKIGHKNLEEVTYSEFAYLTANSDRLMQDSLVQKTFQTFAKNQIETI